MQKEKDNTNGEGGERERERKNSELIILISIFSVWRLNESVADRLVLKQEVGKNESTCHLFIEKSERYKEQLPPFVKKHKDFL